jgi:hypothetical protein
VVNTEIKTRITVHAVELHISQGRSTEDLCANFGKYNSVFHMNVDTEDQHTAICSFHCNQYTILLLILLSFALFVEIMNFFVNNENFRR